MVARSLKGNTSGLQGMSEGPRCGDRVPARCFSAMGADAGMADEAGTSCSRGQGGGRHVRGVQLGGGLRQCYVF